jgi:hypothetical protein
MALMTCPNYWTVLASTMRNRRDRPSCEQAVIFSDIWMSSIFGIMPEKFRMENEPF